MSNNSASLGVQILRYINNSPHLSRTLDTGNRVIKRVYRGYLPGLSRQMLRLSGQIQESCEGYEAVTVKLMSDGIYWGGQRLSENPFTGLLPENINLQLNFTSAKDLAALGRMARSSAKHYEAACQGSSRDKERTSELSNIYLTKIFPLIVGKSKSIEEFTQWDQAVRSLIDNYSGSPEDLSKNILPDALRKSNDTAALNQWVQAIDSLKSLNYRCLLLEKSNTVREFELWDEAVNSLEDVLRPVFASAHSPSVRIYTKTTLIINLLNRKVGNPEELYGWQTAIKESIARLGIEGAKAYIWPYYKRSNNPTEFKEMIQGLVATREEELRRPSVAGNDPGIQPLCREFKERIDAFAKKIKLFANPYQFERLLIRFTSDVAEREGQNSFLLPEDQIEVFYTRDCSADALSIEGVGTVRFMGEVILEYTTNNDMVLTGIELDNNALQRALQTLLQKLNSGF